MRTIGIVILIIGIISFLLAICSNMTYFYLYPNSSKLDYIRDNFDTMVMIVLAITFTIEGILLINNKY